TYWRRYLGDNSFRVGGVEGSSSSAKKVMPCWAASARRMSDGAAAPIGHQASPRRMCSCDASAMASRRTSGVMTRSRVRIWPSRREFGWISKVSGLWTPRRGVVNLVVLSGLYRLNHIQIHAQEHGAIRVPNRTSPAGHSGTRAAGGGVFRPQENFRDRGGGGAWRPSW